MSPHPRNIAISPDGARLYVSLRASNSVAVVNTATNAIVASLPVGQVPGDIAITPDGRRAYVANEGSDDVSVIDLAANAVIAIVSLGGSPRGLAITPDGAFVYVATAGLHRVGRPDGTSVLMPVQEMSVIEVATNEVMGEPIPVGDSPGAVVIRPGLQSAPSTGGEPEN